GGMNATTLDDYLAGDGVAARLRAVLTVIRATFSADATRATAAIILQVVVGLSGPVFALALASLAGAAADRRSVVVPAVVLACAVAALMVVSVVATQVAVRLEEE